MEVLSHRIKCECEESYINCKQKLNNLFEGNLL